jgi:hypothetical protein
LLEGVVDRGLVVRARLLQHVIEYTGASRGPSRALVGRVESVGTSSSSSCPCASASVDG